MAPLPTELRRELERAVLRAREVAERSAEAALKVLAVDADQPLATLSDGQKAHRRALRARMTQLAETDTAYDLRDREPRGFRPLVEEVAYEQWHRMLFARFLAENGLLLHPQHGVAVSLEECADLAQGLGEPDEWMVAARFAGEMLPGIFRRDDPSVRVRFAANDRGDLERILNTLPETLFQADDALGWVYQFWQTKAKDEMNKSGRKVGGKDIFPVTQLFTEHYMVRFLLENSLGAWWAARYPQSPLLKEWEYLRFRDDGTPAAGTFPGWPEHAAEITVMDPCCGSGHFLVAAADMLRKMRIEEEGIQSSEAAGAVLRDNLHGLEIDPRCTQLAAFALAFDAWKAGLDPKKSVLPNIACSGIAVSGQLDPWKRLAAGDANIEHTLEQLYQMFRHAPDLGSLINPAALSPRDQLFTTQYEVVAPLLQKALARSGDDPAAQVFGAAAEGIERAGGFLAAQYTLVTTNPPYLTRGRQNEELKRFADSMHRESKADLATMFVERCLTFAAEGGSLAMVTPQNWLYLGSYRKLRERLLRSQTWCHMARLGEGAFESSAAAGAFIFLGIWQKLRAPDRHEMTGIDASGPKTSTAKAEYLRTASLASVPQTAQLSNPESVILLERIEDLPLLSEYAASFHGISTTDYVRFGRFFWEVGISADWLRQQSTVETTVAFGGREHVLRWGDAGAQVKALRDQGAAVVITGLEAWSSRGVAVSQMRSLPATIYTGGPFDDNTSVLIPKKPEHLPAVWQFVSSPEFNAAIRRIDQTLKVTYPTLVKVPFDLERWEKEASELWPEGLPNPYSNDPTQWIFEGAVPPSTAPLQVAIARLLGFRWPEQPADSLDSLSDQEGIVCIPSLGGQSPGAERIRGFLASAYGQGWDGGTLERLLSDVAFEGKSLDQWLRDGFFEQHCRFFDFRPFIWQIWDGKRDGFSALLNYHRLDHAKLQKLTYTYLGTWIDRQKDLSSQGVAGADDRLAAALGLQRKLAQILEGEKPFDIYVRWKKKYEQPIGWNPDLDDGVRLNIRPFMEAGVLRWKPNIKWDKDRGKNPGDGSDRINDIHLSITEKQEARRVAGVK